MERPTPAQFAAYQQIFDYFNRTLFDNSLPDCMLSFGRHHGLQTFAAGQWRKGNSSDTPEISLNLQQLHAGTPMETMAALVRAMVHLWQEIYGSPAGNRGYFNREWAEKIEEVGLIPSSTGKPGGKKTGQGIKHFIEPGGPFDQAFSEMPESYLWPFRPAAFASNCYTTKMMYRCPGCGTKVWGKDGLGLICGCGTVLVDKFGKSKAGLLEKVCRILMEQCRYATGNSEKIEERDSTVREYRFSKTLIKQGEDSSDNNQQRRYLNEK